VKPLGCSPKVQRLRQDHKITHLPNVDHDTEKV
jgi:hypothetical protein